MPFISIEIISLVYQALNKDAEICVPYFQGYPEHPAGFSKKYREYLMQLSGDIGARKVLKKFENKICKIHVDDPNILLVIDVSADIPS